MLAGRESYCLQVARVELDCVATAWQEPQGELPVIPEATGSSAEARQCHQGRAIPNKGDECAMC